MSKCDYLSRRPVCGINCAPAVCLDDDSCLVQFCMGWSDLFGTVSGVIINPTNYSVCVVKAGLIGCHWLPPSRQRIAETAVSVVYSISLAQLGQLVVNWQVYARISTKSGTVWEYMLQADAPALSAGGVGTLKRHKFPYIGVWRLARLLAVLKYYSQNGAKM